MRRWSELPEREGPDRAAGWAGPVVRLLAPLVVALVLWLLDRRTLAVVVLVVAVLLAIVTTLRPAAGARIARAMAAIGQAAASAVSWCLLAIVDLLVVTPFAALSRLVGHDPLGHAPDSTTGWEARPTRSRTRRNFGPEPRARVPVGRARRTLAAVPRALGAVVLLLGLNYGVGWLWDEEVGSHDLSVGLVGTSADFDELAAAPAFDDDPWAPAYWRAYDALHFDPVPFLMTRLRDVRGPDITSTDGVRHSYAPEDERAPVVWFFGGGALWGEGQRDEHTIPSEVARAAEDAGTPIRVLNFGQPGYTTWQSALLFEQELAVRPPPDLAVFYDGADDVAVQLEQPSNAPTHYNAAGLDQTLTGRDSAAEQAREVWDDYLETSVLSRLSQGLSGLFGVQPAAAADDALVDRVLALRDRSLAMITAVADRADVPTVVTWQAARGVPGDGGAYRDAAARAEGTQDLSRALDDVVAEVYLDGVLTDEEGARHVAQQLWVLVDDTLPT